MNKDKLKEIVERIPFTPLFAIVAAYHGYNYYIFNNTEESELFQKQQELSNVKEQNSKVQKQIKDANDFFKGLESKKAELRNMAAELDGMKATLNESLDIPAFVKMVTTEAKKVGLSVTGIKPAPDQVKKEYYAEQSFDLTFRGVYAQLLVFLDRLSQAQRIVRVDNFDVRPISSNLSKYVEIEGSVQIKTYYYLGSKADDIGKTNPDGSPQTPKPASVQGKGGAGGGV